MNHYFTVRCQYWALTAGRARKPKIWCCEREKTCYLSYSWDKLRPNDILQHHLQLSQSWESDHTLSVSSCFSTKVAQSSTEMDSLTPDVQKKLMSKGMTNELQDRDMGPTPSCSLTCPAELIFLSCLLPLHRHTNTFYLISLPLLAALAGLTNEVD